MRRFLLFAVLALTIAGLAGCTHKNVKNPLADLGSKQPDKVLFDRAVDFMKHGRWDQARMLFQVLINTYPDSEYIARAKLGVADSWYDEGGSAAWAQAENEYRDFITFFPNMTEASEAQMKIANIHFREMEKADRDYTHAKRAEEEYRTMLTQYPDSPLVPQAKERLREVQEVLAEREFLIGRFYYLRQSYAAAEARLETCVQTYPLYSGTDEALYMLGDMYEKQAERVRAIKLSGKFTEEKKGELIKLYEDKAAAAYDKIITKYSATDRVGDAKARLEAMHRPVPAPTPQELEASKALEASRSDEGHWGRIMDMMHKAPTTTMAQSAKMGEPTLVDPPPVSAVQIVRDTNTDLIAAMSGQAIPDEEGSAAKSKSADNAGNNAPPEQAAPAGIGELNTLPSSNQPAAGGGTGNVEVQPGGNGVPGPNQPPPGSAPPVPPRQVNQVTDGQASAADSSADTQENAKTGDQAANKKENDKNSSSSSRNKKKKGLKKLIPF